MSESLDYWFPPLGQCQICGVPGLDARHRVIDAIREHAAVGETPEEITAELDLPRGAVDAVLAAAP